MKRLILLLLLAAPAYAEGYRNPVQGCLDMANAHQWGNLQNHLAAEAPPIKYQVETINKNPAPNYFGNSAPVAPARGINYGALAESLKAQEGQPVGTQTSPFNNSFMPGVE